MLAAVTNMPCTAAHFHGLAQARRVVVDALGTHDAHDSVVKHDIAEREEEREPVLVQGHDAEREEEVEVHLDRTRRRCEPSTAEEVIRPRAPRAERHLRLRFGSVASTAMPATIDPSWMLWTTEYPRARAKRTMPMACAKSSRTIQLCRRFQASAGSEPPAGRTLRKAPKRCFRRIHKQSDTAAGGL